VALRLLDEYFGLNDNFDRAQAHVDRATAFLALGELDSAIASFESALSREDEYPNMQTSAYLELPFLVATRRVKGMYQRCLDLLSMHQSRLMFPIDHFKWHSAKALILWARGDVSRAKESARQALDAAARKRSRFRYHPDVGLVNETYQSTEAELTQLCNA
jgi:tetratricopeptide (TPR) repeat protein